MSYSEQYEGYEWIKLEGYQKHKLDLCDGWECNYSSLEAHYIAETEFLIAEVRKLAALLDEKDAKYNKFLSHCLSNHVPKREQTGCS